MTKGVFTAEFPNKDYQVTTNSSHPQTKFWPKYLPEDHDRIFIFERSKNAQLVVYTAKYLDTKVTNGNGVVAKQLDPSKPLDINWQSFGWTDSPTTNPAGAVELKMAWGYSHKIDKNNNDNGFHLTLNALNTRPARLYLDEKTSRPILETSIGGQTCRLLKVYVHTTESTFFKFIPKVNYVELYGTDQATGKDCYEKYIP